MADPTDLAADLLTGGADICIDIYGNAEKPTLRKFYYEVSRGRWPVFRLDNDSHSVLYALRSKLRAHVEAKTAEREARMLAAEKVAAVRKVTPPKARRRQRRRARSSASVAV
jgi:hypothetical protein